MQLSWILDNNVGFPGSRHAIKVGRIFASWLIKALNRLHGDVTHAIMIKLEEPLCQCKIDVRHVKD